MKKVLVTGGNSRFSTSLKKIKANYKFIYTNKNQLNILNIKSKNINLQNKDKFLDFLAIESTELTDKNYEMKLIFSGDSIIRITAEVIEVTLDDQGAPWESKNKPKHRNL